MRRFRPSFIGCTLAVFLGLLAPGCGSKSDSPGSAAAESNPLPVLTSLSPDTLVAGSPDTVLALGGTRFVATSTVSLDGTAVASTYGGPTQLQITVPASALAEAGTRNITVTNPAPGGGTSSQVTLSVTNPVPTLASLAPASLMAGTASGTLTITGTGFISTTTVTLGGVAREVLTRSATELSIALTTADLATAGTLPVVVASPAPGGGSATRDFTVEVDTSVRVVPKMTIAVANGAAITSKEDYLKCTITIDGKSVYADYSGTGKIRGRGNSTWLWYDKKPYRIKLDTKSEILGLKEEKDWVLLANYRDPTFMMNAFAFDMAERMGLPYTNHSRFLEVTLNGDDIGLYQLTEQVEQGANRVAVADAGGMLLSMDADDGPELSPGTGDNFWSTKYSLPICVKYPENQTSDQLGAIQADFALLEDAVASGDYDTLAKVMDISSLIDFLLLQELTDNVELSAPRSMYIFKDPAGLWTLGPVWDFDGGFSFDWGTMMTGHNFFGSQGLILGTRPASGGGVSDFYVNMFGDPRFVSEFKARWATVKGTLLSQSLDTLDTYSKAIADAMVRNAERWPTDKVWTTEMARMKAWLTARATLLDTTIKGYPAN